MTLQELLNFFSDLSHRTEISVDRTLFAVEVIKSFGCCLSPEANAYIKSIKLFKKDVKDKEKFIKTIVPKLSNNSFIDFDLKYYKNNLKFTNYEIKQKYKS